MSKPRLLDLFCGAGGAGMGYSRAGFEVVGVDLARQPYYPFEFHNGDALEVLLFESKGFDLIHASPPCHDHSSLSPAKDGSGYLLAATIDLLKNQDIPWVVENVVGKDVKMDGWFFRLCGSMFDMRVRRHRRFGASFPVLTPACQHANQGRVYTITGHGGDDIQYKHSWKPKGEDFWKVMDMPWMEGRPFYGVTQAIPPAYTQFIAEQFLGTPEGQKDEG